MRDAKSARQMGLERKCLSREMQELARLKSQEVMSKYKTAVVSKKSKYLSTQDVVGS